MVVRAKGIRQRYWWGWGLPLVVMGAIAPGGAALGNTPALPSATVAPGGTLLAQQQPSGFAVLHVSARQGHDQQGDGSQRRPFRTITQALRVAQPNTVIVLAAGIYSDRTGEQFPLQMRPGVTIQGNPGPNVADVVIQGSGSLTLPNQGTRQVTILGVDGAGLANVTVNNPHPAGYGLWISQGSPVVLRSAFVGSGVAGIYLAGGGRPVIEGNFFLDNGVAGLVVGTAAAPQVQGNVFEATGTAIAIAPGASPRIVGNRITGNGEGLLIHDQAQPSLGDNQLANNQQDQITFSGPWEQRFPEPVLLAANPSPASPGVIPPPPSRPDSSRVIPFSHPLPGSASAEASASAGASTSAGTSASPSPTPPLTLGQPSPLNPLPTRITTPPPRVVPSPPPAAPPSPVTSPTPGATSAPIPGTTVPQPTSAIPIPLAPAQPVPPVAPPRAPSPATVAVPVTVPSLPVPTSPSGGGAAALAPVAPPAGLPRSPLPGNPVTVPALPTPASPPTSANPPVSPALPNIPVVSPEAVPLGATSDPGETLRSRLQAQAAARRNPQSAANGSGAIDIPVIPPPTAPASNSPVLLAPLPPATGATALPPVPSSSLEPDPDILVVPDARIPLGSGGPSLLSLTPLSGDGPPPPPNRASSLGLLHRVFVPIADEVGRARLRVIVPDAFRVQFNGQSVMQAGAFATPAEAEARAELLRQNGFPAQVEFIP